MQNCETIFIPAFVKWIVLMIHSIGHVRNDSNIDMLGIGEGEERRGLHFNRQDAGHRVARKLLHRFSVRCVGRPNCPLNDRPTQATEFVR
ncbi:hypothetical protein ACP_1198 [Acidobacterium capsulatum ATCC 51196]|uniref:Uncharacterized protein n=1 Tax=Acidobacterium capsulatum (strain ATCC 51196 / DSM 11244 / BCRC 80197 / JCM 7670 / NBRC 15755 / NCIMB 13165 / 161) TaxID=240015 RepID=C1F4S7_ACIC5|nr:hypothetical protein ACP_1198 [Acidobacterium capsulatum ATCC 51196]